jgi:clan AA aspartic protease (TIGR02281 family)
MGVLFFAAAGYVLLSQTSEPKPQMPDSGKNIPARDMKNKKAFSFSQIFAPSSKSNSPAVALSVGTIIIYDITGNEVARLMSAVSESGWLAVPEQLGVRGYRWFFYPASGDEQEILGGILGDQDDIGIWQLNSPSRLSGPPIVPVSLNSPVTWKSIVSEKSVQLSGLSILSEQQNFYHIFLADSMNEPGVLIQDQKIVGWSFGDLIPGGYLWKGPDESNLVYELSVYDYYRLTFENSREEQFIIGYSQKEMNPADRLEAFANGFRQNQVLAEKNTPDYLKSESVVAEMRSLIAQIIDDEGGQGIASIVDSKVLAETGDVAFLIDVLTFGSQINGPEHSIRIVEQVLDDSPVFNASQRYEIRAFQKELYRKWLTVLMNEKDYPGGMEAYRQAADVFGDDSEIHLLGVKLALIFDDWQAAEKILYSRNFPINLTDQVRVLEKQIAELKFQEDKIVIRFSPGSDQIPVSGILNNRLSQDFIVDTGASMVTIPTTAAEKLGITINAATPLRKLVTAGGVIEAPEVILHSIQLDGWTEYNVSAYIVDMPNQSGTGLLGLNYLKRFRMDLNTKSGVLTLAPR